MSSFDTILVANRGEIAQRVFRTARHMGYRTAAVFSEADRDMPYVAAADRSLCIGPAAAALSYLDIGKVIAAARDMGAGAIHPGYGFLSENAEFAEACAEAGIVFIGPSADAIRSMGDKATAKALMQAVGVPCIPGFDGETADDAEMARAAGEIGYPLMIKAVAGGGGKGMRLVTAPGDFEAALRSCRSEASKSFGNPAVMLERALVAPRHVEVQIMADAHGMVLALSDRDCSVQRRHQKILEEAPAPFLSDALRAEMTEAAGAAARAVDYRGAGTVEFLVSGDSFYFLEMNTRLQVEHPVTELVTGCDLVELQIRVARGEALPPDSGQRTKGHAIEVRLYAEDPDNDFLPQSGRIGHWAPTSGPGLRTDAGIAHGVTVTTDYDPMLAKIMAHGETRDEARRRLRAAVAKSALCGLTANHGFLLDLLGSEAFASGALSTKLLDDLERSDRAAQRRELQMMAAALLWHRTAAVHSSELRNWASRGRMCRELAFDCSGAALTIELSATPEGYELVLKGGDGVGAETARIEIETFSDQEARLRWNGVARQIALAWQDGGLWLFEEGISEFCREWVAGGDGKAAGGDGVAAAPMSASVVSVEVAVGDVVAAGDMLGVLEAMKMEHQIHAGISGAVAAVHVAPGMQVSARQVLFEIAPHEGGAMDGATQEMDGLTGAALA